MVRMESVSKITCLGLKMTVIRYLELFSFLIPLCMWLFVTEFVTLGKNLPFYKAVENNIPHGGISKKRKKSRPLFTIIFRPKETILDTYSILNL